MTRSISLRQIIYVCLSLIYFNFVLVSAKQRCISDNTKNYLSTFAK